MTPSPFARRNADLMRAERRDSLIGAGHLLAAGIVALSFLALVRLALLTALAVPDIIARSAAVAAW